MSQKSVRSFFATARESKRQKMSSESEQGTHDVEAASHTDPAPVPSPAPLQLEWAPFNSMEDGWKARLAPEFNKPYFKALVRFLDQERTQKAIFPPEDQVFTAFSLCPYDSVKVVIVGQDPYHGPRQAHGLAFSVQQGVPSPPSLKNVIKEAMEDVGITKPAHGCLSNWSRQGVLLLNTVLTVEKGAALSHKNKGWETFTTAVMSQLNKKEDGVVFLAWGKPAEQKCTPIKASQHRVLTCSHPSPLAAHKTSTPFIGSKIFSKCNAALIAMGKEPVDWSI